MKEPSSKQLLRKMSGKASPDLFLKGYQAHIRKNYPQAIDIIDQYYSGKLIASSAVFAIKNVVSEYHNRILKERDEEDIRFFKRKNAGLPKPKYTIQFHIKMVTDKNSSVILYENKGQTSFYAKRFQDAMRLVDNKQNSMDEAVYATITSMENGKPITTVVSRQDSLTRMRKTRSALIRTMKSSGSMKSYMRVRNDVSSFSRG